MKRLTLLFCLVFNVVFSNAQIGCTDVQALNFEPTATENDGSCQYPSTTYELTEITVLPDFLQEISGLVFFDNGLWGQLDASNDDELYKIDSLTGEVLHTTIIANAENIDWEDLAEDDTYIYICDCGNNVGNRTDLRIYKVPKAGIETNVAFPEIIDFSLNDQTDFSPGSNDHNYDLEALFVLGDSIHLFSKNWADFKTRHYVMPKTAGTHIAEVRDSLNVQGQITSADISDDGEIILLGYNSATSQVFYWLLFDYPAESFFDGNKRKISLGSALNTSQIEAVCFRENGNGYIGAEKFSVLPPRLHKFSISPWTDSLINTINTIDYEPRIHVFPNPTENFLIIRLEDANFNITDFKITGINIFDGLGREIAAFPTNASFSQEEIKLDLSGHPLKRGPYFLQIQTDKRSFSTLFFKQ